MSTMNSTDELSAQLLANGFDLPLTDAATLPQDVVRCLYSLLAHRVDDLSHREALTGKLRQIFYDLERSRTLLEKEQGSRAAAERELAISTAKLNSALANNTEQVNRQKFTIEELNKARLALAFVKQQCQHDQRKRELEVVATLSKWQRLSSQSSISLTQSRLITAKPLPPPFHSPLSDLSSSSEVSLLEDSLRDLEEVRSNLVEENTELRNVLASLEGGLSLLLSAHDIQPADTWKEHSELYPGAVHHPEPHLVLAPTLLESQLEALIFQIRDLLDDGKVEIEAAQNKESSGQITNRTEVDRLEAKVQNLEDELERAQALAAESDKALREVTAHRFVSEISSPAPKKAMTPDVIRVQKDGLEVERLKFTEAAVKLGRERAEFEAIRLEFEQEKRTMTAKLQAEAEIQPFLKSGHATKPVEEEKLSTTKPLVAMPPKVISRRTALKAILDSGNSPVNPPALTSERVKSKTSVHGLAAVKSSADVATTKTSLPLKPASLHPISQTVEKPLKSAKQSAAIHHDPSTHKINKVTTSSSIAPSVKEKSSTNQLKPISESSKLESVMKKTDKPSTGSAWPVRPKKIIRT